MTAKSSSNMNKPQRKFSGQKMANAGKTYWYFLGGIGLVVLGVLVSTLIATELNIKPYVLKDGISIFALLFIMAQALERFMEPFTEFVPTPEKPNAEAVKNDPAKKEEVKAIEQQRTIFIWGITSFLAMLASAVLGVYLLRTIGATEAPLWADITVTGLAVGAGTKPLHDLIKRLEKAKES